MPFPELTRMASYAAEELYKLESLDIAESRCNVSRMQKRLENGREPALLSELVEFYLATASKRALAVLTTLKGVQSQVSRGSRLAPVVRGVK